MANLAIMSANRIVRISVEGETRAPPPVQCLRASLRAQLYMSAAWWCCAVWARRGKRCAHFHCRARAVIAPTMLLYIDADDVDAVRASRGRLITGIQCCICGYGAALDWSEVISAQIVIGQRERWFLGVLFFSLFRSVLDFFFYRSNNLSLKLPKPLILYYGHNRRYRVLKNNNLAIWKQ